MRIAQCLILTGLLFGCRTLDHSPVSGLPALEQAKAHMEDGEFYQARNITEAVLKDNPGDPEAQQLMAEILDREIERHKDAFETRSFKELSSRESKDEVQTWLERSRS